VDPTADYTIASISSDGDTLYLLYGETVEPQSGDDIIVTPVADVTGQSVSLTSPYNIGTASVPFLTNAASGLTVDATATSPSSAAIHVDNSSPLAAIGVSTYDGSAKIQSDYNISSDTYADSLSFANNVLAETGDTAVTFTNTDNKDGSDGDVILSGTV
jgi:hypothetical protein